MFKSLEGYGMVAIPTRALDVAFFGPRPESQTNKKDFALPATTAEEASAFVPPAMLLLLLFLLFAMFVVTLWCRRRR